MPSDVNMAIVQDEGHSIQGQGITVISCSVLNCNNIGKVIGVWIGYTLEIGSSMIVPVYTERQTKPTVNKRIVTLHVAP